MKKRVCVIILGLVLILIAGGGLWYTRPMTIEEMFPAIDLSKCTGIQAYGTTYIINVYEDKDFSDYKTTAHDSFISSEDPEFSLLMEQFENRTFRRTLRNLLGSGGTKYHLNQGGDFRWELIFQFEDVHFSLPDGSTITGDLLHFNNFYEVLEIRFNGETRRITTADKDEWLSAVMDIILAASQT